MQWRELANGTAESYSYAMNASNLVITKRMGAGDRSGISAGSETATTYNEALQIIGEETKDIESGLTLTSRLADLGAPIDGQGRPSKWIFNGNLDDYSITQHGCCGLEFSRDRSGATATYFRDPLKRVYKVVKKRSSGGPSVTTNTAFNGLGSTTTRGDGSTTLLVSESTRSLSGLATTSKSPDADGDNSPETTTRNTVYNGGGGSTITTTYPDGTSTVSLTFTDGSRKSMNDQSGATSTSDKGTHALNGGGLWNQMTAANGTQWTKSYADQLGRSFRSEYPDGALSTMSYYPANAAAGSRSKLHTATDPDENAMAGKGSLVTHSYNAEGERTNTSQTIADGHTRTTITKRDVVSDPDIGVSYRSTSTTNGVLANTSLRSGNGYGQKSISLSGTSTSIRTVPNDGAWTITSTSPDGTSNVQTYSDGLAIKSEAFDSNAASIAATTMSHDAYGRTLSTTDARTGISTINGYLENGSPTSVTSNGGNDTTSFTYDVMGRTIKTTLPDNSETHTSYTSRGQTRATWGSQTNPRFYQYDALGRMSTLHTYQVAPALAQATVNPPAGSATTTWIYDNQRGFLLQKKDDDNKGASYTYTASGKINTRTWARGGTTTYTYDQESLENVNYSDTTPDIAYSYDNFGRPLTVTRGSQSHDYAYDAIGNRKKSADSLTLPATDNYTANSLNQYTQGSVGVPPTTINPSYAADGNATAYPLPIDQSANSTLTWDGENRLISVTANGTTTTYTYDYKGRRVSKTTASTPTTHYLYDGWNLIAEYQGSIGVPPILSKTYTWGMDLSGTLQGAGGVGGLLSVNDGTARYYPTYDGNGNISQYLDNTGDIVAHYEYRPFRSHYRQKRPQSRRLPPPLQHQTARSRNGTLLLRLPLLRPRHGKMAIT